MSGRTGSYNVLLAITLAESCQCDGKVLPSYWQSLANTMAKEDIISV
ncbi:hypothetical protein [Bacteroides nordii]|nr:hypothetical protein [Bacteroides nordii]